MPKLTPDSVPKYRKHKASGQALVTLNGNDHYLGPHGSRASRIEYDRLICEWIAGGRRLPDKHDLTIVELVATYWRHATKHYTKNGQPTAEVRCIKSAVKPLKELYGRTPAGEFGPLALKAVREKMVANDLSRKYVNKSIDRIRRMFRWAAAEQLLSVDIYQQLQAVTGLEAGRTTARETPPRGPVPPEHIEMVKAKAKQRYRDLIDLRLLTGARPGELLSLTTAMIDQSGEVWTARLQDHKTVHRGKERILFFGPKAQLIQRRHQQASAPSKRLFPIGVYRYWEVVTDACSTLEITRWSPHWLRHSCGTLVREEFGAEAAQVILGHAHLSTTEMYAKKNMRLAMEVIQKVG